MALGLVMFALGASNPLFFRSAGPLAGVGPTIAGLAFVTKGLRGFARQRTPAARSRAEDAAALSLWRAPWLSFYSRRFYDDVGRRGRGVGLQYLLALEASTWLVFMIAGYSEVRGFIGNQGQRLIAQVPPIAIHDGRVQIDAPQPYYIRFDQDKGSVTVMALDTTGEITSLENRPDLALLLTRDKLYIRQTSGQIRIHDLSATKSFEVNQAILRSWIERYTVPLFAIGYVLTVLGGSCYRLVQALLYAAIGLGFASLLRKSLSYGASLRLSIAAVTPVILIGTLLDLTDAPQASGFLWWFLCLAAAMGFLAFGVKSLADGETTPAVSPAV